MEKYDEKEKSNKKSKDWITRIPHMQADQW